MQILGRRLCGVAFVSFDGRYGIGQTPPVMLVHSHVGRAIGAQTAAVVVRSCALQLAWRATWFLSAVFDFLVPTTRQFLYPATAWSPADHSMIPAPFLPTPYNFIYTSLDILPDILSVRLTCCLCGTRRSLRCFGLARNNAAGGFQFCRQDCPLQGCRLAKTWRRMMPQ